MPATQLQIESQVNELTTESMESFCSDLGGMFGLDIAATADQPQSGTAKELGKKFKKLVAVNSVVAEGALDGRFYIIFDHNAAFIMSGTIIMLPEKRILQNCKIGSVEEARHASDAIGETGNLMVGSFDKVFRQGLEGHKHFTQTNVYIGKWGNSEGFDLDPDKPMIWMPYEINLGEFDPFTFTVAMPVELIDPQQKPSEPAQSKQQSQKKTPSQSDNNINIKKAVATIDQQRAGQTRSQPEQSQPSAQAESARTETPAQQPAQESAQPQQQQTTQESPDAQPTEPAPTEQQTQPASPGEPAPAKQEPEPPQEASDSAQDAPQPPQPQSEQPAQPPDSAPTQQAQPENIPSRQAPTAFPSDLRQAPTAVPSDLRQALINTFAMPIERIMRTDVLWCSGDDTVIDVQAAMTRHNSRHALIGANGIIEGIISACDLRAAQSVYLKPEFSQWRGPYDDATLKIKVKWLMAKPVRTARPNMAAGTLIEDLAAGTFTAVPVLNAQSKVVGLVTACQLLGAIINICKDDPEKKND